MHRFTATSIICVALLAAVQLCSAFTTMPMKHTAASSTTKASLLKSTAADTETATKQKIVPPIPSNTGSSSNNDLLLNLANEFIYTSSGFYSPADPSVFSEDFVFRGPYIGPLNKKDYLTTMETFQIYKGLPDISPNAFGFSIDPKNQNRVWFLVRNTGTFTGQIGLGFGQFISGKGQQVQGCPETFSITFDDDNKVKLLTVGYVADRFEGNTGGKGAAIGIFNVIGLPVPSPGPLYSFITWFSNNILDSPAKSCSRKEDVPKWWQHEDRGADGYS